MQRHVSILILTISFSLYGCSEKKNQDLVTIAINPWPGYEFLYLAQELGYFEKVGAPIKLVQVSSLSDSQRAYINGRVDGFTSTLIEAVLAEPLGGSSLKVVMIPDYSNGGDVIMAASEIESVKDLKGKRVGCEVTSLGIYVLQRALSKAGLTLNDVEIHNVEQLVGEKELLSGNIDAFVTYPPTSINIAKHGKFNKIFSTAEIPNEVIDTVSISEETLIKHPDIVEKLLQAWQLALDYTEENSTKAYTIMASRERISATEFVETLNDIAILSADDQKKLFKNVSSLKAAVANVCNTLTHVNTMTTDCSDYPNIFYTENKD